MFAGAGAIAALVVLRPSDASIAHGEALERPIEQPAPPPTLRGCPRADVARETSSEEDESVGEEIGAPADDGRLDRGERNAPPRYLQTVHVVTRTGATVPGVVVEGPPADGSSERCARITDETGSAVFRCLEGRHDFDVLGFALFQPASVTVDALRTLHPVTVVLEDVAWVAGRVAYDGGGVPNLAELEVEVEGPAVLRWRQDGIPPRMDEILDPSYPRLDSDGSFRIPVPSSWNEVEVAIGTPVVALGRMDRLAVEIGRARFPVPSAAAVLPVSHRSFMGLCARVVDESGVPVEGARLYMERVRWHSECYFEVDSRTDCDGRMTVFPLSPGSWTVSATSEDGREGTAGEVRVVGPEWPEVTIRVGRE